MDGRPPRFGHPSRRHPNRRRYGNWGERIASLSELASADDVVAFMQEPSDSIEPGRAQLLLIELALLQFYLTHEEEQCEVKLRPLGGSGEEVKAVLRKNLEQTLERLPGFAVSSRSGDEGDVLVVEGPGAKALL